MSKAPGRRGLPLVGFEGIIWGSAGLVEPEGGERAVFAVWCVGSSR